MCLSERSERHERIAGGWLPVSAFAERALTVILPPDPQLRETPSCFLGNFIRRASSSQSPLYSGCPSVGIRHAAPLLLLSPPNPLRWALAGTPIKCLRCTSTACSGKTVAAGQLQMYLSDHHRTKQVGMQEAVYVRMEALLNFDGNRPQWAEN